MPFHSSCATHVAQDAPAFISAASTDAPVVPLVAIIIPTYNEAGNIEKLTRRIIEVMGDISFEIVIVDDNSPDHTWAKAQELARHDGRIRCLRRIGRRGLSGACIEGMLATIAPYLAVIDGDLQHDETLLPKMVQSLNDGYDLVVGSRLTEDGSAQEGFNHLRQTISHLGRRLLGLILKTNIRDTMSGFFMVRRSLIEKHAPALSPTGFKILADILSCAKQNIKATELGYHFRQRHDGTSKFNIRIGLEFAGLVLNKASFGFIPLDFVSFAVIGASGVIVHVLILRLGIGYHMSFNHAQIMAALCAMVSNYCLNNLITWRHLRLRGWLWWRGLILFCLICSASLLANVSVAALIYEHQGRWLLASLAGLAINTVWNYAVSAHVVWSSKK